MPKGAVPQAADRHRPEEVGEGQVEDDGEGRRRDRGESVALG